MTAQNIWTISDIASPLFSGEIEIENGEHFHVIVTAERVVFGGVCNAGFLESGFMLREDYESIDESLQECAADLEVFYNDGPSYVSRIICNERM